MIAADTLDDPFFPTNVLRYDRDGELQRQWRRQTFDDKGYVSGLTYDWRPALLQRAPRV